VRLALCSVASIAELIAGMLFRTQNISRTYLLVWAESTPVATGSRQRVIGGAHVNMCWVANALHRGSK
jgi:hypothetical protein